MHALFRNALGAILGLALAGALAGMQDAAAQTKFNLKIGLSVPDIAHLPLYVADAQGIFKEEGLDAQLVTFESDSAAAQGLTAGAVQVNSGSIAAVLDSYSTGRDLITFWSDSNLPGYIWYGNPKFSSIKDLKGGGKIGISSIASLTHRLSQWVVAEAGMDPAKDVQYVAVGGPLARVAALKAGQVDAIPATPPGMFLLEQDGFKALLNLKDVLPEFEYETFYARKATLTQDADAIKAMLRAYVRGIRWAKANPDAATDILMKNLGAQPGEKAIYRKSVDMALPYFPENGAFAEKSIDVFLQFYLEQGKIKSIPSHDAFTDYSFIEAFKKNPVK